MKFKRDDLSLSQKELQNIFVYFQDHLYYSDEFGSLKKVEYSLSDASEKMIDNVPGNKYHRPVLAARIIYKLVRNFDSINFDYIDRNPLNIKIDNLIPKRYHEDFHKYLRMYSITPSATGIKYVSIRTAKSGEQNYYIYKYIFDDSTGEIIRSTTRRCIDFEDAKRQSEEQIKTIIKYQER